MERTEIQRKAQVVLGPTMSQTQNALMQYEAGSKEVEQLQQDLHEKVEQDANALPQDELDKALQFNETIEECCGKIEERGIQVNEARFNSTIDKAMQTATEAENDRLHTKLDSIQRNLHEVIGSEGIVHPKLTSLNSITGRINVRKPALQN